MATLYGIELFDTDGKAIEPGFGGAHFESDTPFPIPNHGDFILSMGRRFTLENITYEYKYEDGSERLIAAATIVCRLAAE
jgi:hypothetical protein